MAGLLLVAGSAFARGHLSARKIFLRLPTSFFENTGSSLSEGEKYLLIANGSAGPWVIRTSMPDMLELESFEDGSRVSLCLFRGEPGAVAALGADMGPVCITELWKVDDSGGLSPRAMPPEVHLMDFFTKGKRIPADISVTTTFCVHPQGLEVRPQFWSPVGEALLQPDNAVFYIWTGRRFSKRIVNIQPK